MQTDRTSRNRRRRARLREQRRLQKEKERTTQTPEVVETTEVVETPPEPTAAEQFETACKERKFSPVLVRALKPLLDEGWSVTNLVALGDAGRTNSGDKSPNTWVAIARALPDQVAAAATFARIARWKRSSLVTLAGAFGTNAGGLSAAQWAEIAVAHPGLKDKATDVTTLARFGPWTKAMATAGFAGSGVFAFLVAAAGQGASVAALRTLVRTQGFPATAFTWSEGDWSDAQLGQFAGAATVAGLSAVRLRSFMRASDASAIASHLRSEWGGAAEVGKTVGHVRSRSGAPSDSQFVDLLFDARDYAWKAAWVRKAADGSDCGPPAWSEVLRHAPTFADHWTGPRGAGGMGGSLVSGSTFWGPGDANYKVRLSLYDGRVKHAENGHTFERFALTYPNCMRNYGGTITLYAAGTNVKSRMTAAMPKLTALADWVTDNGFGQDTVSGDRAGVDRDGRAVRRRRRAPIWPTALTQFYPLNGTKIAGKNLVAIGRLMGKIG